MRPHSVPVQLCARVSIHVSVRGGVGILPRVSPVAVQMWRGERSRGADDVAGVGQVLAQMWQGRAQTWCRCGQG